MSVARSGIGYDSHRLEEGRPLVLGGVEIPDAERGLAGHSDADVLAHAVIDALLGAAGLGDIGQHFPDTDERWRDADSHRAAAARCAASSPSTAGPCATWTRPCSARRPSSAPHRDAMRASLADARRPGAAGGEREVHDQRGDGLRGPRRGHRGACRGDRRKTAPAIAVSARLMDAAELAFAGPAAACASWCARGEVVLARAVELYLERIGRHRSGAERVPLRDGRAGARRGRPGRRPPRVRRRAPAARRADGREGQHRRGGRGDHARHRLLHRARAARDSEVCAACARPAR